MIKIGNSNSRYSYGKSVNTVVTIVTGVDDKKDEQWITACI